MLGAVVNMLSPLVVHRQPFQEVVKVAIVNCHASPGNVRRVHVDQVIFSRHIGRVEIQGVITLAVIKDSPVGFTCKDTKPLVERYIPGRAGRFYPCLCLNATAQLLDCPTRHAHRINPCLYGSPRSA